MAVLRDGGATEEQKLLNYGRVLPFEEVPIWVSIGADDRYSRPSDGRQGARLCPDGDRQADEMALFQKRKATQLLMVMVSHPGYAREFTAAEAEKLIAQGADVNAAVPAGGSPLGQTCIWGNVGVARTLLDHGADPKGIVREDIPPLHTAAMNGHDELVRLLVERGSSVNSRDKFGCTPLHSGVVPDSGRRNNIPETLISLGADPNLADENGQTPLARFAHTVQTLVGRPPFGNETQADRDRDDRQLTDDFRRLTALFSGR